MTDLFSSAPAQQAPAAATKPRAPGLHSDTDIYRAVTELAKFIATATASLRRDVKPWRRTLRRRTLNDALRRIEREIPTEDLHQSASSYLGLLRQASHNHRDRCRIANLVRRRGLAVDHNLTKAYPHG